MGSLGVTPQYGRRLLHTTVDDLAESEPHRAFASIPFDDDDLSKGYEDVTYAVLANAVNKLAWFISACLGPPTDFETIAYIGRPDMRYQIMSLAAAKTQYKVLFSSHMHSPAAHLALMEKTQTQALFIAEGVEIADILVGRPMPYFVIPELDDLLTAAPAKRFPYTKTFEEAAQDPYLILHSSGTTGMPKPITYNHAALAAMDARGLLSPIDPTTNQPRRFLELPGPSRYLVPFLHFHGVCSVVMPVSCIFGGATWISGFRRRLTSKDDICNVLTHANINDAFLSPAMVEDIVAAPDAAAYLSKIRMLLYGGAPMHHSAAAIASQHTNLQSQWGITESAKAVDYMTSPEDYDYCAFDMAATGFRMELVEGTDNLYHMHVDRTPASEPYTTVFQRCPDLTTFDTGDIWEPHPDPAKAPFTWRFRGRTDDLISYAEGSNFHPTFWELKHAEHPLVRTAVLSGSGHRQPCLLLELHDPSMAATPSGAESVLDRLWHESIQQVNALAPRNGQVARTHVVFSREGKLFARNVKGTVARKATIAQLEPEIEACYARSGDRGVDLMGRLKKTANGTDLLASREGLPLPAH